MKIGIIGAGNIGGNLTRRLTALGHDVSVANSRGPETLSALVEETGATAVTAAEAARGAQVVVVTVPLKAVPGLPAGLIDGAAEGVAVIDTGNYYPQQRDGRIAAIEDGTPESRWTEEQIGHPVIKAFNGTYAQDILSNGLPKGSVGRQALPVTGDDAAAKRVVRDLIDELGFDTVDAGGPRRVLASAARHARLRSSGRRASNREGSRRSVARAHGRVARLTIPDTEPSGALRRAPGGPGAATRPPGASTSPSGVCVRRVRPALRRPDRRGPRSSKARRTTSCGGAPASCVNRWPRPGPSPGPAT